MAPVQQSFDKNLEVRELTDNVLFEDYYDITGQSKKNTGTFSIPLGITEENNLETLGVPHLAHRHILVTGYPGSGKSTFLHVLLNTIFLTQTPQQTQIWLHDCRGYEFDKYRNGYPPHISFLSTGDTESACEAFMQSLEAEYKRRQNYLLENREHSFDRCARKLGDACIPRLFVIIDCFDAFLLRFQYGNSYMAQRIESLLRTAFALGVTFIATSQSCTRWPLSMLAETQFGVRILLRQSTEFIREQTNNPEEIRLVTNLMRGEALVSEPSFHKVKLLYISSQIEDEILKNLVL